ncbi:MAG: prolipoprotein diacylglyceryl transferase [Dysgonamonadaceae bacterium]|jgi:prolipoprotein diacylglyceryl transferase|nr:prolipoprotein diacylglyceryl transferase [Dysgonamonadaceae bacterium]
MLLSFITWSVDPVAFRLPLIGDIRWYGIAFVLGFYIGGLIIRKIWKNENLNEEWFDKLFFYVIIATIIGARLGHILFYDPMSYFRDPIKILAFREGGLASHGGTIGIIVAIWIYSRRVTHKSMLWTFDRLVVPVGFVAALIRLGNLMNHEIYGHATNVPWAFRFIENVYSMKHSGFAPIFSEPSHPTQLYEAFFYILTACICLWMYWKRKDYKYEGLIFGVFLIGIFLSRFIVEFWKNNQEAFEEGMPLNMGQLLSIPFIIAGIWLAWRGLKERKAALEAAPAVHEKPDKEQKKAANHKTEAAKGKKKNAKR